MPKMYKNGVEREVRDSHQKEYELAGWTISNSKRTTAARAKEVAVPKTVDPVSQGADAEVTTEVVPDDNLTKGDE